MKKTNYIFILMMVICIIIFTHFFLKRQNYSPSEALIVNPTVKVDSIPTDHPKRLEILKKNCKMYPNPTDVVKYNLSKTPTEYCAICGDGICDYIEKCLSSNPMTADCGGGFFCQRDCN